MTELEMKQEIDISRIMKEYWEEQYRSECKKYKQCLSRSMDLEDQLNREKVATDKQLHDFRCAALSGSTTQFNTAANLSEYGTCNIIAENAEAIAQAMLKIARGDK